MKIQLNGQEREFEAPVSVSKLIERLSMKEDRVAVELNRNIVPREQWGDTTLSEGDRLEVVHFVGGGLPSRKVERITVDLASYPDLIVIYLGMRVRALTGLKTLIGFGPKISNSVALKPEGLLRHESILYSLFPPHVGMRQYWRDFESLERWSRSEHHRLWWTDFLRNSRGTGFWHETYFKRGGIEAIYDDMRVVFGLS